MVGEKRITIIDVGHGNCAVLADTRGIVVIDAGPGSALLEFLTQQGIRKIDVILISHADQDHIEGLIALLASGNFEFGRVRLNTDSLKNTSLWDDLTFLLGSAHLRGQLNFEPSLSYDTSGQYDQGDVHIEILAPTPYLAAKGPGGLDRERRKLTSNSISAVLRLSLDGQPIILFAADLDDVGFANLKSSSADARAPILVFPHHGGNPGKTGIYAFAVQFLDFVRPETVIFSTGRGQYNTPIPQIVNAVIGRTPPPRVICTELSEHCAKTVPPSEPSHLRTVFARGRIMRKCCGGSIEINLSKTLAVLPEKEAHDEFINAHASSALCKRSPLTVTV